MIQNSTQTVRLKRHFVSLNGNKWKETKLETMLLLYPCRVVVRKQLRRQGQIINEMKYGGLISFKIYFFFQFEQVLTFFWSNLLHGSLETE